MPDALLFIGRDAPWQHAVRQAAAQLGMPLEIVPEIKAGLRHLLRPDRRRTHLLATEPLSPGETEALAGMADGIAQPGPAVLRLGDPAGPPALRRPDPDAVRDAISGSAAAAPPPPARLSREEVRHGLNAGWLRMRFQPMVRARDLQPVGVESLARLHHPSRGILYPEDFVPQAVACGQERVFTGIMGARAMLDLQGLGLAGLRFGINLPIPAFCHELTVERALMLASVVQLEPARVAIEVLETTEAPDLPRLAAAVGRWRDAGFAAYIDDAGPALPHWRALTQLPFTGIKLDRALAGAPMRREAETIAAVAHQRGLTLICEGVETEAELAQARAIGADSVQGYLVSRPLPAMALPLWLADWRQRHPAQTA